MGFLARLLKQDGTYWAPHATTPYDEYGDQSWVTPAEIKCRWEDRNEVFLDTKGEQRHSKVWVWSTTSMAVDGYLFLGTSSTANPETVSGADKILRVEAVPDVKNRMTLYKAWL